MARVLDPATRQRRKGSLRTGAGRTLQNGGFHPTDSKGKSLSPYTKALCQSRGWVLRAADAPPWRAFAVCRVCLRWLAGVNGHTPDQHADAPREKLPLPAQPADRLREASAQTARKTSPPQSPGPRTLTVSQM